jgi:hypothetical protein
MIRNLASVRDRTKHLTDKGYLVILEAQSDGIAFQSRPITLNPLERQVPINTLGHK